MVPTLKHRSLRAFEALSPDDVNAVLAHARTLQRASAAGTTQALLRGKNFGLMCEADAHADAVLFRRAMVELGAHVAHIRPSLSELSTPLDVQHTARMLGRLYDAVECQGMGPAVVQQMGFDAGVPVYDGIAAPSHPSAALADLLGGEAAWGDRRRFVLQAMLLSTLA